MLPPHHPDRAEPPYEDCAETDSLNGGSNTPPQEVKRTRGDSNPFLGESNAVVAGAGHGPTFFLSMSPATRRAVPQAVFLAHEAGLITREEALRVLRELGNTLDAATPRARGPRAASRFWGCRN